jgi:hypothetical protein
VRELSCKGPAAGDCCNSFHAVGLPALGQLQQMRDCCCSDNYLQVLQDLQGNGVKNVVVVAESSWARIFAAADQNMYLNSQDSLHIRQHNIQQKSLKITSSVKFT